jgi:excisionase family DNA binding protein
VFEGIRLALVMVRSRSIEEGLLMSSRFMSVSDVARYCDVTNRTVLRWVETKRFVPTYRTPSGRVMFNREDVFNYFSDSNANH